MAQFVKSCLRFNELIRETVKISARTWVKNLEMIVAVSVIKLVKVEEVPCSLPDACWETLKPHTTLFRIRLISAHCHIFKGRLSLMQVSFFCHSHCGNLLFKIKDHDTF